MSQPKGDDSNLSEVKAVLGRLQRISRNPHAVGAEIDGDDAPLQPAAPAEGGGVSRPAGGGSPVTHMRGASALLKVAVTIGLAVAAGVAIFVSIERRPAGPASDKEAPPSAAILPTPERLPDEAQKPQNPPAALHVASELMASGQVRAARDVLLRVTKEESADVAWALARSYDPNFLVTIQASDADPDVAEATRWYRAWYDIAVKQGLVADSVSLDRIIKSMSSN